MEERPVTRSYLETLATSDLIKMADNLGIDVPPELDRVFIIDEILDICSADDSSVNSAENGLLDTVFTESAPLPRQYNITFIEVMIRDPLWAFVFWELKTQDKEQIEKSPDFEGYYMKVSPIPEEKPDNSSQAESKVFRIPVKPEDTAWYLGLSPTMLGEISQTEQNRFRVDFCADIKGEESVLISSKPVKLPALPHIKGEQCRNQLVRLSGYDDFNIIRNNERLHRSKKVETSHE